MRAIVTSFIFMIILKTCDAQYALEWDLSNIEWIQPADMDLDNNSNLIIAGKTIDTTGNWNMNIIKLDPFSSILWQTIIDDGDSEIPIKFSVNDSFICVSGTKYDQGFSSGLNYEGLVLWKFISSNYHYDNVISKTGNIYIADGYEFDFIALEQNGIVFDSCDNNSLINKLSKFIYLDGVENKLISGTGLLSSVLNWYVEKLDANCNVIWETYFQADSFSNGIKYPVQFLLDLQMNSYLIGTANIYDDDYFLAVKYNADGIILWHQYFHTISDIVGDAAVDVSGNLFVTGYSYDGNSSGCVTIMYDSTGNQIWLNKSNPIFPTSQHVRIGPDNSVIVLSRSLPDSISQSNFVLRQLDYTGNEIWSDIFPGRPSLLAVDSFDNIYVCGSDVAMEHTIIRKYAHTTGIREFKQQLILNVFPNPLHTTATIVIPQTISTKNNLKLLWSDFPGRVMKSEEISSQKNYTIDRVGIANGMYVLKLVSDNQVIATAKIVVQ